MEIKDFKEFYWDSFYKKNNINPDDVAKPLIPNSPIKGVNALAKHLYAAGGPAQQSRMIKDKRRSLDKAVLYSYQGAFVKKYIPDYIEVFEEEKNKLPARALINPNKLKQDYDDKVISIGFEHGFQPGDVFEWCQTGTYWLIYLQDLTELAYFRGDIRKCSYVISWEDENGNKKSTHAAIRGPVETKIESIQKYQNNYDIPNYSLNMLIPKNKDTLKWCKRYTKFLLSDGLNEVCWRIEAVDAYSTPGIINFNAVEYYINKDKDDTKNQIIDGLVNKLEPQLTEENLVINGEGFIKPKKVYTYLFEGANTEGRWEIDKKTPVVFKVSQSNNNSPQIQLKWNSTYSGQFEIKYITEVKTYTKTIVVESLF